MTDENKQPEELNEEDLIDQALAALDEELPSTPTQEPEQPSQTTTEATPTEQIAPQVQATQLVEPTPEMMAAMSSESQSPTLQALDETRRPSQKTVCERCPHSVWFASPEEVKCYCRVMFLVSWSTKEPNQITNCDGEFLGGDD